MPRRLALNFIGVPHHVIQRGNNRQPVFFADRDRDFYLDNLSAAAARHGCEVHAYVLMTNHVHLLVTPQAPLALSLTMRDAGRRYAQQYVNGLYGRTGTLWEGRYRAILVDSQRYFLACCRYVECNPVRAGMVARPEDYRWSSYGYHAHGAANRHVSPHPEYLVLGATPQARQCAYRSLFDGEDEDVDELRNAVAHGWPYGGRTFIATVEASLAARTGRSVRLDAFGWSPSADGAADGDPVQSPK